MKQKIRSSKISDIKTACESMLFIVNINELITKFPECSYPHIEHTKWHFYRHLKALGENSRLALNVSKRLRDSGGSFLKLIRLLAISSMMKGNRLRQAKGLLNGF